MSYGIYYQFMSLATDNVGNVEPFKSSPDTILDFNTPPIDLFLSNSTVAENAAIGTFVGTFTTIDNDITLPFTYELVSGTGDFDNNHFTISGNSLYTNQSFACDGLDNYYIRLRTTDMTGLYLE